VGVDRMINLYKDARGAISPYPASFSNKVSPTGDKLSMTSNRKFKPGIKSYLHFAQVTKVIYGFFTVLVRVAFAPFFCFLILSAFSNPSCRVD